MREGKKGQRPNPNHATVPVSISTDMQTRARAFPTVLLFVFLIPRSFTVFGEWARLSSVGSVWHLQGSLEDNEVLCQCRTRLLDCSIGGALRVSS